MHYLSQGPGKGGNPGQTSLLARRMLVIFDVNTLHLYLHYTPALFCLDRAQSLDQSTSARWRLFPFPHSSAHSLSSQLLLFSNLTLVYNTANLPTLVFPLRIARREKARTFPTLVSSLRQPYRPCHSQLDRPMDYQISHCHHFRATQPECSLSVQLSPPRNLNYRHSRPCTRL